LQIKRKRASKIKLKKEKSVGWKGALRMGEGRERNVGGEGEKKGFVCARRGANHVTLSVDCRCFLRGFVSLTDPQRTIPY